MPLIDSTLASTAEPANQPTRLESLIARLDPTALRDLVGLLPSSSSDKADSETIKFVLFTVGSSQYAVPLTNVVEILRIPKVTRLPHVPDWLRGVINLRGDVVSVVDLRQLLDLPGSEPPRDPRLIVLRSNAEVIVAGFVVDSIIGQRGIGPAELKPCSERAAGSFAQYLSGWFDRDEKLVPVFDVEHLLAAPKLRQFDAK